MAVNMESSKLNGYEKYPGSSSDTATGIPVNSSNQYYIENPAPIKPRAKVPWSTGLFDCFSDCRNCKFSSVFIVFLCLNSVCVPACVEHDF